MAQMNGKQHSKLANSKNWIHHFLTEADDFLKIWEWDKTNEVPPFTVQEDSDAFHIEVVAPGMKNEDVNVHIDNGILIISALTREEKDEHNTGCEISYRNFRRSFWLPESVNPNEIEAKYENGLLKLRLSKGTPSSLGYTKVIPVV